MVGDWSALVHRGPRSEQFLDDIPQLSNHRVVLGGDIEVWSDKEDDTSSWAEIVESVGCAAKNFDH